MKELNVYLHWSKNKRIRVGKLAEFRQKIFFEYASSFLSDPLWLSPYKLPPEPGLHEHKDREFGPIFGLFDDSLPDGWGLLLMDRFLRKQDIDPERFSVLDRLSFLGESTMGALTYEPAVMHEKFEGSLDLKMLADASLKIIAGEIDDVLPQLMNAGGSPGGARPKVLVGIKNGTIISGENDLPDDFEHWIIKFNSDDDFPDYGAVEYAYSLMAGEAGITMPQTRLFHARPNARYFGIKRFDRKNNQRFHVHTFGNLIHSNFRVPACDYETFLRVILDLTKNHKNLEQGFCRMIFNVMAHNRDDHVKNFAFMMDEHQEWTLTPAYDLVYSKGPGGEHSMTIAGEGRSPGKKEIVKLGQKTGVSAGRINEMIEQVASAVERWQEHASTANVTEQTKNYIQKKIKVNRSFF